MPKIKAGGSLSAEMEKGKEGLNFQTKLQIFYTTFINIKERQKHLIWNNGHRWCDKLKGGRIVNRFLNNSKHM